MKFSRISPSIVSMETEPVSVQDLNSLIDVPVLPVFSKRFVCIAPAVRESHFKSIASIEEKFFLVFAIWFEGATAVTNEYWRL